jgi:hypothetical protein
MLSRYDNYIGADPEFLFEKKGKVVESSKAIKGPKVEDGRSGFIIRDGYQGEFNPYRDTCRQMFARNLEYAVSRVNDMGYKVRIGAGHWVPESEFANLTKESKEFGCVPSENAYGESGVGADPKTYMFRPLGGHIHLSLNDRLQAKPGRLVRLLDIFVGLPSVAFDQDPLQVERRKHYGRAGEFRIKSYGIEYRTLSNFWLSHYVYLSMVYGLARQALSILAYKDAEVDGIFKLFADGEVEEIINSNNKEKAIEAFGRLRPVIIKLFEVDDKWIEQRFTLTNKTFDAFIERMKIGDLGFKIDKYATPENLLCSQRGIESTLLEYARN